MVRGINMVNQNIHLIAIESGNKQIEEHIEIKSKKAELSPLNQ